MSDKNQVSVVIPVYNEEANLPTLMGRSWRLWRIWKEIMK